MFFTNVMLGLVIGIAAITPGLSGGTLAAALGLYEPLIYAISHLFKHLRQNVRFLLPLGIGGVVGILGFSNVMEWLMELAPGLVSWLFLGLVAGSLPALLQTANAKGFRWQYPCFTLIALAVLPALTMLQQAFPLGLTLTSLSGWPQFIFCGLIVAVGTIVPGISTSFMLMSFGYYDELLGAVARVDLATLLPVAIGFAAGVLLLARLVDLLFRRYHSQSYYAVLGFLVGSALLIIPPIVLGWGLLLDAALFTAGVLLSLWLLRMNQATQK